MPLHVLDQSASDLAKDIEIAAEQLAEVRAAVRRITQQFNNIKNGESWNPTTRAEGKALLNPTGDNDTIASDSETLAFAALAALDDAPISNFIAGFTGV